MDEVYTLTNTLSVESKTGDCAVLACTHELTQHLLEQRWGRVVEAMSERRELLGAAHPGLPPFAWSARSGHAL